MKKNLYNGLKPIPESKMSPEARLASDAHRRATRKKVPNFVAVVCR